MAVRSIKNFKIISNEFGLVAPILKDVEAEPITLAGRKCFVFKEEIPNYARGTKSISYNVSDCITGMMVARDRYKKTALEVAEGRISAWPKAVKQGEEIVKKQGFKLPINE